MSLRAENVSVSLGGVRVLHGVSLSFEQGTFTAVLGPNGAGKSTLLKTLVGLREPEEGQVVLGDREVRGIPRRELARSVSFLPQASEVPFPFPVEEVVLMGRYARLSRFRPEGAADRAAVARALESVDGTELRGRPVNELSGGEHQRVLLARTLATEAPTLLLDEPIANLDIRHSLELLDTLKGESSGGRTVVIALHDVNLASRYADRFVLLHRGRLLAEGGRDAVLTPERLREAFEVETRREGEAFVFFRRPK